MNQKLLRSLKFVSALFLFFFFLACNLVTNTLQPTQGPMDTPIMLTPSVDLSPSVDEGILTPIPPPVVTPGTEPSPSGPVKLPAPLYYLSEDGQIMRLEVDGRTISKITNEPEPVTDFDVFPGDNRLVYISDNNLIESAGDGTNRTVKVSGGLIDLNNPEDYVLHSLSSPNYSPDGSQIAFGLNGINIIPSGSATDFDVIQPSDPYPDLNNPGTNFDNPIRFYRSAEWSPDGTRLAIHFSYYPEAGGIVIKNLVDGNLVELENPLEGITCCDWGWSADSQTGFLASDLIAYGAPGLVRYNTSSGLGTTLVDGLPPENTEPSLENPIRLFKSGFPAADGSVKTFIAAQNSFDAFGSAAVFTMNQVAPDGAVTPLRSDAHPIWEALWAQDGSGAIIVDTLFSQRFPPTGPMRWLPADGTPVLDLPARGSNPKWGRMPETAIPTQNPTMSDFPALESQALADFNIQLSENGISGLNYGRINSTTDRSLWFVHTTGLRDFNTQRHTVGIYAFEEPNWVLQASNILPDFDESEGVPGPDYLSQGSIKQVFIEPDHEWLSVDGGIGAHGGTFHLLQFNGTSLTIAAENSNGSPGAGFIKDINNDGLGDVLLDLTDFYIFSYAAGVRLIDYQVLTWNGTALVPVQITRLDNNTEANELNNQAVNQTEAELWKDARNTINQALELAPGDETIIWNTALINTIADARENAGSSYPLMDLIIFGDYNAAINILNGYSPEEIFSLQSPLILGTSAEGSEEFMAEKIHSFTTAALTLKPDLAPAHFLRAWAAYLLNPDDSTVLSEVQQAASIDPNNEFYANTVLFLQQ